MIYRLLLVEMHLSQGTMAQLEHRAGTARNLLWMSKTPPTPPVWMVLKPEGVAG